MKRSVFVLIWAFFFIMFASAYAEFYAFLNNYDPQLGPKDLEFTYGPTKLVEWFFLGHDNGHNRWLYTWTLYFISMAVVTVFCVLAYSKWYKQKPSDVYGSSRWLETKELRKKGFVEKPSGVVYGYTNDAIYNFSQKNGWKLIKAGDYILDDSDESALISAPPGSGKGLNNVIPSLLSWTSSAVVYDIKKENYNITAGFRKKFSHVFPFEPTSAVSARWNPLLEIEPEKDVAMAQNIANILAEPPDGKRDHWVETGEMILVGFILHVLYAEADKSLYGIFRLLNDPSRTFKQTLHYMLSFNHLGDRPHPAVEELARNLIDKSDNELSGYHSTVSRFLKLYQDPIVGENTRHSDFYIKDLVYQKEPMSLYLIVNPNDAGRLTPLTRLMFTMIFNKLTEKLDRQRHKLLLLIDELPSLGKLETLEKNLGFFRGYGIKCMLIVQSYQQLYSKYGQTTSIPDTCKYKIFMGADSYQEGELVSKLLGQKTVQRESISRQQNMATFSSHSGTVSSQEVGRALLTPNEVMQLPYDDILFFIGHEYPYKAKKVMYYQDPVFKKRFGKGFEPMDSKEQILKEYYKNSSSHWITLNKSFEPNTIDAVSFKESSSNTMVASLKGINETGTKTGEVEVMVAITIGPEDNPSTIVSDETGENAHFATVAEKEILSKKGSSEWV